jgi:peptide/nickel transport system substrate-binding protein
LTARSLPTRRGRTALLLAVAFVTLVATACSAGSSTSGGSGGKDGGGGATSKLSIGFIAEPANLDFSKNDGAAIPQALLYNVYEGLVKLDINGKIQPLLAKSWQISKDRKVYTFQLQDGVKFTNGKPFTAQDAVFSINRVKTDWTISLKAGMDVVKKAEAVSPTVLKVTLSKPSNSWLFSMTSRIGAMFSRTGVSNLANKPIGTGPYKLQKWNRGDSIVLVQNPDYLGKVPAVKTVTLRYFKDPSAMNNALLSGDIQVVSTVQTPESLGQFTSDKRFRVIEGTSTGEVVLSMNNAVAPLSDKRVRQAIRYGINHKALLDTAWAGRGKLIGSMVPPTDPWYQDLTGMFPFNPTKAKSLLKAAGATGKTLRLRVPTLPYAIAAAQVVKSQLEDIGLKIKIDQLEFPARWLDLVFTKGDYDMSIINHVEPRDITTFGNPDYYWHYDNPKVQQLIADADAGTEQQQVADLRQVARTISADAAADWLFLFPNLIVADKNVQGLPKNAVTESFDLTGLSVS